MTIDLIEWRQGCCGAKYAEVEQKSGGWMQLWKHDDIIIGLFYTKDKQLIAPEKVQLSEEDLISKLNN